jgi:ABC-type transport system involved in multi-copper enzyme maturation permease subunit
MSTLTTPPPTTPGTAPATNRFGNLLRAELHRFRARRFIQVLVGLAVLGWIAVLVISLTQYGIPDESDHAAAEQRIEQEVQIGNQFRQECVTDSSRPADVPVEEICGPEMTTDSYRVEDFLDKAPFDLAGSGQAGALAFAAGAAIVAFLIGATWIGAEWSTRSLVALLFWETRRFRVFGSKIAVLVGAAALFGVVAQAGWLIMATILRATVGTDGPLPHEFWSTLLGIQARSVLLTVFAALAGFGLANLVRNTGAALGVGFVYFAIVENAVGAFRPTWSPWLLTANSAALIDPGGISIPIYDGTFDANGMPPEVFVSNLHAGVWLGAVLAVVVGLGVVLFARRDVH